MSERADFERVAKIVALAVIALALILTGHVGLVFVVLALMALQR